MSGRGRCGRWDRVRRDVGHPAFISGIVPRPHLKFGSSRDLARSTPSPSTSGCKKNRGPPERRPRLLPQRWKASMSAHRTFSMIEILRRRLNGPILRSSHRCRSGTGRDRRSCRRPERIVACGGRIAGIRPRLARVAGAYTMRSRRSHRVTRISVVRRSGISCRRNHAEANQRPSRYQMLDHDVLHVIPINLHNAKLNLGVRFDYTQNIISGLTDRNARITIC